MNNATLVVFYSHSGNTRKIAELIQRRTQADLFALEPIAPYPAAYDAVVNQARKEIQAGFHPALKAMGKGVEAYQTVFVGTPNWWSTIAPPIATFLSGCDLAGKTVVPFCTHGGGGAGRVEADIAKLCPRSVMKPALVVSGSGGKRAETLVGDWLRELAVVA